MAAPGLVGAVVAAVFFAAFRPVPPSASAGERAGDIFEVREPAGAQDTAAAVRIADDANGAKDMHAYGDRARREAAKRAEHWIAGSSGGFDE